MKHYSLTRNRCIIAPGDFVVRRSGKTKGMLAHIKVLPCRMAAKRPAIGRKNCALSGMIAGLLCFVMLLGILSFQMPYASAAESIRVFVNDAELVFSDVKPFSDKSGRIIVPVRIVAEAMGCEVDWDENTKTVTLSRGRVVVELTIGKKELTVFGLRKTIDTAAQLHYGRTFVPLRSVAEALGAEVAWDGATGTVTITDYGKDRYRLGGFTLDIEQEDTFGMNEEELLVITKGSGLVLEELHVGNGQTKAMAINISVDVTGTDVERQLLEANELLRQRVDSDLVEQIMTYAATKTDGDTVIERRDFKDDKSRVYVTGYIGPTVLYVYL